MDPKLPLPSFFESLAALREEAGLRATLLGIGPMSERIVRVSLELARRKRFPLMFIASRNQVDLRELGGGYVCSWDQVSFVEAIRKLAEQVSFTGLCYVCRDHGGPWQRDGERRNKLAPDEAMEIAKRSYLEDLLRGFDLLHIDPTKDPHPPSGSGLDTVIQRTVELIDYIEAARQTRSLPPISYEVGTEETSGGLTDAAVYAGFIERLNSLLSAKGLPLPAFIVGQTGTLVRMTENVGHFDSDAAEALSRIAVEHSTGLKEHNADYLDDGTLLRHPLLGITAANVAPEFGVQETAAYLELGRVEQTACSAADIPSSSHILDIIPAKAVAGEHWRKWMMGDEAEISVQEAGRNDRLRMQIARICGHYTFADPEVLEALDQLRRNLSVLGIHMDRYVDRRVESSIDRYVTCFNLENLTTRVLQQNQSRA